MFANSRSPSRHIDGTLSRVVKRNPRSVIPRRAEGASPQCIEVDLGRDAEEPCSICKLDSGFALTRAPE
jgi:hypothetical protein